MPDPKNKKKKKGKEGDDPKVVTNDDGTITVDGKKYIVKDSYDEVAKKARDRKTALEKQQKEKDDAEKKRLEEEGKYKELAEAEKAKNEKLQAQMLNDQKQNAIQRAASEAGAQDASTIAKLIDDGAITVDDEGKVNAESIKTAVDELKESQPYLFGDGGGQKQNVGNSDGGAGEGDDGDSKKFYRSQLSDSAFYTENRDDILAAEKAGNIVDDINS